MKKVSLKNFKKEARKGLLSRFRKEDRGAITLEIAIAFSFLGFGFVGLVSSVSSIDNAHAGEQALNDVVMTARALPNIASRTDEELSVLFNSIAGDNLRSNQYAEFTVSRTCGCPLEGEYSPKICTIPSCNDGLKPSRYLDLDMSVKPRQGSTNQDIIENFNYQASVRY